MRNDIDGIDARTGSEHEAEQQNQESSNEARELELEEVDAIQVNTINRNGIALIAAHDFDAKVVSNPDGIEFDVFALIIVSGDVFQWNTSRILGIFKIRKMRIIGELNFQLDIFGGLHRGEVDPDVLDFGVETGKLHHMIDFGQVIGTIRILDQAQTIGDIDFFVGKRSPIVAIEKKDLKQEGNHKQAESASCKRHKKIAMTTHGTGDVGNQSFQYSRLHTERL